MRWDESTLLVHSPKTSRYAGRETRIVPIVPELMQLLSQAFHEVPARTVAVVDLRSDGQNMRTQLARYAAKAGVPMWGKPFMNMRQSLANDWAERFPAHACHAWLGHSRVIAERHYLRVDARTVARAVNERLTIKAVQKPVQQIAAGDGDDSRQTEPDSAEPSKRASEKAFRCKDLRLDAIGSEKSRKPNQVHLTGLEPVTFGSVDRREFRPKPNGPMGLRRGESGRVLPVVLCSFHQSALFQVVVFRSSDARRRSALPWLREAQNDS